MNLREYSQYDATGLAELVKSGEVTAKELAQTALEGVEKVNPKLNAIVELFRDRVDDLDENSLPDGPFTGGYQNAMEVTVINTAPQKMNGRRRPLMGMSRSHEGFVRVLSDQEPIRGSVMVSKMRPAKKMMPASPTAT